MLLLLLQNLSCQFSGKLDCFKYQGPLIAIIMVETLLTGHYSEKALMFVPLFKGYTYTGTERLSMTLFDFFFLFSKPESSVALSYLSNRPVFL